MTHAQHYKREKSVGIVGKCFQLLRTGAVLPWKTLHLFRRYNQAWSRRQVNKQSKRLFGILTVKLRQWKVPPFEGCRYLRITKIGPLKGPYKPEKATNLNIDIEYKGQP